MKSLAGFKSFITQDDPEHVPTSMDTEVVNLYLHSPTRKVTELARTAGVSVAEFYRILRKYDVEPCRLGGNQGLVRTYKDAGYSVPAIAELTGYTPRNVRYILSKNGV